MFDILGILLSKTIEIVLDHADLKKDKNGPMKMYELYLSLRKITLNARKIADYLEGASKDQKYIKRIVDVLENQAKELRNFAQILWSMIFYLEIFDQGNGFDRPIHDELSKVLGMKFMKLRMYFEMVNDLDTKVLRTKEIDRTAKIIDKFERHTGLNLKSLEDEGVLKSKEYKLTDAKDLEILRSQTIKQITGLEETLDRLACFIRDNCELRDLFPKS